MCALAAEPRYQDGPRVKTNLVYVDYLMGGHDWVLTSGKTAWDFGKTMTKTLRVADYAPR